jgi:hypothetical protein
VHNANNVTFVVTSLGVYLQAKEEETQETSVACCCARLCYSSFIGRIIFFIMLQLEFKQTQDGISSIIRVSFLNSSLFLPTESQKKEWDKHYLKYRIPRCNFLWQQKELQSLYYWATRGLKHMKDVEPFQVKDARALDWILRQYYKTTLGMHFQHKDNKLLKWKFMEGRPGWGNLHVHAEYPTLASSDAPVELSKLLQEFNMQRAFQFLRDKPNMMLLYKRVVPAKTTALTFFIKHYPALFQVRQGDKAVLSVHRQVAMLQAKPVLKQAYEEYVMPGSIAHSDFFRFAISRDRVEEGVDEQQLGTQEMMQLFQDLKKEETLQYKQRVVLRLRGVDSSFDLRHMEGYRNGYGIRERQLVYETDFDKPGKVLLEPSCKSIIEQMNRKSDRELNKI